MSYWAPKNLTKAEIDEIERRNDDRDRRCQRFGNLADESIKLLAHQVAEALKTPSSFLSKKGINPFKVPTMGLENSFGKDRLVINYGDMTVFVSLETGTCRYQGYRQVADFHLSDIGLELPSLPLQEEEKEEEKEEITWDESLQSNIFWDDDRAEEIVNKIESWIESKGLSMTVNCDSYTHYPDRYLGYRKPGIAVRLSIGKGIADKKPVSIDGLTEEGFDEIIAQTLEAERLEKEEKSRLLKKLLDEAREKNSLLIERECDLLQEIALLEGAALEQRLQELGWQCYAGITVATYVHPEACYPDEYEIESLLSYVFSCEDEDY